MKQAASSRAQRGLTLLELMVAMLLGLLLTGAALSVVLTVSRTNAATESLSRIQEGARLAFDLLARDVREAGGNACSRGLPVANVLNNSATAWWGNWNDPVRGYDDTTAISGLAFGSGAGQRVSGTDAIELKSGLATGYSVEEHKPTSANFKINTSKHSFVDGDIVMVCDYRQAALLQLTNVNASNRTLVHNTGTGTPGNCSKGLGFKEPMDCSTNGTAYTYGPNSQIARVRAVRWYVGNNGRGGRSLFQAALRNSSGTPSIDQEEVIEGVTNLQIEYLVRDAASYVSATAVAADAWQDVVAVRMTLTLAGAQGDDAGRQRVGTDGNALTRQLSHVVFIRSRSS